MFPELSNDGLFLFSALLLYSLDRQVTFWLEIKRKTISWEAFSSLMCIPLHSVVAKWIIRSNQLEVRRNQLLSGAFRENTYLVTVY